MARKSKLIKISHLAQSRHRKPDPVVCRANNHRIRRNVLFILKLAAVLLIIYALARHRIWRLK